MEECHSGPGDAGLGRAEKQSEKDKKTEVGRSGTENEEQTQKASPLREGLGEEVISKLVARWPLGLLT